MPKRIIQITELGGSGTMLYGGIMQSLGLNMGRTTNREFDNLGMMNRLNYHKGIKNPLSYEDYPTSKNQGQRRYFHLFPEVDRQPPRHQYLKY